MNEFIKADEPKKRSEGKAATRARILEVAKAELEEKGFDGTNIRAVAEAAGVATGTVVLHFADKRELLHAALFGDLEATWHAARDADSDRAVVVELTALADAFFRYYARRERLSRALLRESLFADPPWSTRFAAQVAELSAHVSKLVSRAKDRGEIRPELDPQATAAAFLSFYYFALLAWLQGGHPAPLSLFETLLRQHLGVNDAISPAQRPGTSRKKPKKRSIER